MTPEAYMFLSLMIGFVLGVFVTTLLHIASEN